MQILVVRAGALGDLLVLRPAISALSRSGHRVTLLAPSAPASLFVGPGAVDAVLPWDGPEVAALLAGAPIDGPVARALAESDAVVAYSRSAPVLDALAARVRRLVHPDPAPPNSGPHAALWLSQAVEPLLVGRESRTTGEGVLEFTAAERERAESATSALPDGFLAVHPGSGSPAKNWPVARFVDAARAL